MSHISNSIAGSAVNNTVCGFFGTGCSPGTLVGAAGAGAAVLVGIGGLYYLGSLAKRGVVQLVNWANWFAHGYQFRNDTVFASQLLTAAGAAAGGYFVSSSGLSHPYAAAIAVGAAAGNWALLRYSPSTRPLEPAGAGPLMIDDASPLHLDAETCLFTVPPNDISCHSVGAALELLAKTSDYRQRNRFSLEQKTAREIRAFYAADPLSNIYREPHFDLGGQARELLGQKYGASAAQLTQEQMENRRSLLETMGTDKEHPRALRHPSIPGVRLSENQLSGWLMDTRQQVYTQSLQPAAASATAAT